MFKSHCIKITFKSLEINETPGYCGEGNGNPLRYSCLENPMDRGAWWATVHGVARVRHDWVTKPHHPCTEEENSRGPRTEPQESSGSEVHLLTILWKFLSVLLQSSLPPLNYPSIFRPSPPSFVASRAVHFFVFLIKIISFLQKGSYSQNYTLLKIFLYLFLVALSLHCCLRAFSSGGKREPVFIEVGRLLIEVASLVAERRLWATGLSICGTLA